MTRKNTIKKLSVGTASLLAATTVLGAATTTTVKAESNRADRARMEVLLKYLPYVSSNYWYQEVLKNDALREEVQRLEDLVESEVKDYNALLDKKESVEKQLKRTEDSLEVTEKANKGLTKERDLLTDSLETTKKALEDSQKEVQANLDALNHKNEQIASLVGERDSLKNKKQKQKLRLLFLKKTLKQLKLKTLSTKNN
uniref:M-like protein n=1 Tax=Streptococcus canis TaxID=1329 RepID=A0A4D6YYB9_STRCB|nr:M-like protein [Streptococcus canis]